MTDTKMKMYLNKVGTYERNANENSHLNHQVFAHDKKFFQKATFWQESRHASNCFINHYSEIE